MVPSELQQLPYVSQVGAARLVPQVSLLVGIDLVWARWLPGVWVLLASGAATMAR